MVERSETTRIGGYILRDARERSRENSLLAVSRDHTAVGLDCFSSFSCGLASLHHMLLSYDSRRESA
ncbi:MAG: hypothetical protein K2M77_08240 [Muribaculaceae bacterium]|nr:hypothetical protein [Muribaculaceae bacterium]